MTLEPIDSVGWLLFYAFTAAPLLGLVVAGAASTVIVSRLGERWLLLLLVVMAMMAQHQVLEAVEFVRAGGETLAPVQEGFETAANLVLAGATYHVLSFARDERRLAEELERTTERYNRLVANAPSAIVVVREGRIVYANPEAATLFDRDEPADLDGSDPFEFVAEDCRDRVREAFETAAATGDPTGLGEIPVVADGARKRATVTVAPITYGGEAALQVVLQDVTERYEFERQLGATLQSMTDAVFVVDVEDDEILDCNEAACEMLDYEREELVGLSASAVHPDEMGRLREFAAAAVESESGVRTDDLSCRRRDGRSIPAEISGSTVEFRGRECLLAVVRDVSERRRRKRRLDVLDRMLRHNLRNDMNVVIGQARRLRTKTDDDDLCGIADTIEGTAAGLIEMSDGLREIRSTIERDGGECGRVDAAELVEGVADDVREERPETRFDLSVPDDLPVRATARLRIAIEEVVENAVVHGDDPIRIEADGGDPSDDWVDIRIADEGPGMPRKERAVFVEGEDITPLEHGTGLGLWLAIWVVEAFDGEVEIGESAAGGTAVTLRLRRCVADGA